MSKVLVFGHKNPDNDAIMSATMFAELKNQLHDGNEYIACRLGGMPRESELMLEKCGFKAPQLLDKIELTGDEEEPVKVILTDHNECCQSVDGLENAQIVGIVDHHRIGNFSNPNPIFFVTLPWGSCSSIVAYLYGA